MSWMLLIYLKDVFKTLASNIASGVMKEAALYK